MTLRGFFVKVRRFFFEDIRLSEHDPYADIRPYRDDEVAPVLARLLKDPELTGAIAAFRFGGLARLLPVVALSVGAALLLSFGGAFAIEMLQRCFSRDGAADTPRYVQDMLRDQSEQLHYSG